MPATQPDTASKLETIMDSFASIGDTATLESVYDAIGDALSTMDLSESYEEYIQMQRLYFALKAALRARDDEFQHISLPGTRVHVPEQPHPIDPNPVVDDVHGEIEIATKDAPFRVMDGLTVADPRNPHMTHQVHIDHVVSPDGDVTVEIDGVAIDAMVDRTD